MCRFFVRLTLLLYGFAHLVLAIQADEPANAREYRERGQANEAANRQTEALRDYSEAIELDPRFIDAYFSRSALYTRQGAYADAVADLSKILDIEPNCCKACLNRGINYASLREYDKAIADYSKVMDRKADFFRCEGSKEIHLAQAYYQRGRAYHRGKSDYAKGVSDYTEALKLGPKMSMCFFDRGSAYYSMADFANAEKNFAVAVAMDDSARALNNWAWQLATCPDPKYRDGKKAFEYAKRANEAAGGNNVYFLDTLAAANAEVGQFDEAVKWQKKALGMLMPGADLQRKAEMENRIKQYEAGKPVRTEILR